MMTVMQQKTILRAFLIIVGCLLVSGGAPARDAHAQTTQTGVDMVWETDSYTPPFYKGKALPPGDADVRIIATPDSSFGNPATALYTWRVNGTVLGSLSGIGKSSLFVAGSPFITDRIVTVDVESADGTRQGLGVVQIPVVRPIVRVYEDQPLSGVRFENTLAYLHGQTEADIILVAYPYFFSTQNRKQNLEYSWLVGGQTVGEEGAGGAIIARSDIAGTSTVSVSVRNFKNILQRASASVKIVVE